MLRACDCDVEMDFDRLAAKGSALGSAGIMVMDSSTDMVQALLRTAHFFAHESCGQCTPCREGCGWMERVLTRIHAGQASATRGSNARLPLGRCPNMLTWPLFRSHRIIADEALCE